MACVFSQRKTDAKVIEDLELSSHNIKVLLNRTFYSCLLRGLAFAWLRGRW